MNHSQPVPRGYRAVEVTVGEVKVYFLSCRKCGCLVTHQELHKNFHKAIGG